MSNKCDKGVEVLTSLTEDEWFDLHAQLRLFIARRYRGPLRDESLISEAFKCVMQRRRQHWDVNKSPLSNMCDIVKSLAWNHRVKLKKEVSLDPLENFPRASTIDASQSPARVFEDREMDQLFISHVEKAVAGDTVLELSLPYLFADPPFKPAEIAAAIHVDPTEIYKALKRLRRRIRRGDKG